MGWKAEWKVGWKMEEFHLMPAFILFRSAPNGILIFLPRQCNEQQIWRSIVVLQNIACICYNRFLPRNRSFFRHEVICNKIAIITNLGCIWFHHGDEYNMTPYQKTLFKKKVSDEIFEFELANQRGGQDLEQNEQGHSGIPWKNFLAPL